MRIKKVTREYTKGLYVTIYQFKYKNKLRMIYCHHDHPRIMEITKSRIRHNPSRYLKYHYSGIG